MPYLQLRAGFWRVRMPIPKHRQEIIGRGSRLTRALHTADREEADRLSLPVVGEFMDIITAAEAEWQKSKLPMEWGWVADQPEPITFFDYEIGQTRTITFPPGMKQGWVKPGTLPPGFRTLEEVDGLPGYPSISLAMKRAAENSPAPADKITMTDLIALWVAERKVPIGSQRSYTSKVKRLVDFLGHDDPTRITDRDMIRYKEHLLKDPDLTQPTVAGHLDDLRTPFRFAAKNKKITSDPLVDVTFKPKRNPHKRRPAWLGAFSGMRLGEIVEADTRDIVQLEGHWVFRVGLEHRDTSVKTETSLRDVPIHSAIIREGFLDYVSALKPGPLFPMIAPDRDGKRSDSASAIVNPWLRTIGITDPRKTFHCHRHTVKTLLRGKFVPEDVTTRSPAIPMQKSEGSMVRIRSLTWQKRLSYCLNDWELV